MEVRFYEAGQVADGLLRFAVIVSRYRGQWVLCKHRERDTYEVPGGHREDGEAIDAAARRELFEETGALRYTLVPVCVYSVVREGESFGMLYFAEIEAFGELPQSEIERTQFFDGMPEALTYPDIQPKLMERVMEGGF